MDPADAAELIAELNEDRIGQAEAERFRNKAALLIAFLAAMLAIAGLGGGNATDDLIGNNIRASDSWAFYQAKNMRQTAYELEVDALEASLPNATPDARASASKRIAAYRATIARYDSEPDAGAPGDPMRGEGKKELRARAESFEAARDQAAARDDNFDLAEVALQLALVLGSVAILAVNRAIFGISLALGLIGSLLTANGFLLLVPLPL